jgi:bifunctional non-homologous end joining protein LigD
MVRRDGSRVRCFTRGGYDWADRFPAIVDAALGITAASFLIDGEAVIAREDGTPDFHALRSQRRGSEAVLYAFDLLEHDGNGLRRLPLLERKRRLARLLGWAKRPSIQFVEHLTGDGPTIFDHVCRLGLEGIVSTRIDAPLSAAFARRTPNADIGGAAQIAKGCEGGLVLSNHVLSLKWEPPYTVEFCAEPFDISQLLGIKW